MNEGDNKLLGKQGSEGSITEDPFARDLGSSSSRADSPDDFVDADASAVNASTEDDLFYDLSRLKNPFEPTSADSTHAHVNTQKYAEYADPLQQGPVTDYTLIASVITPDTKVVILRTPLGEDLYAHEGDGIGNQGGVIADIFSHGITIKEQQGTVIINIGKYVGNPAIPKITPFTQSDHYSKSVTRSKTSEIANGLGVFSGLATKFGPGGPGGPDDFSNSLLESSNAFIASVNQNDNAPEITKVGSPLFQNPNYHFIALHPETETTRQPPDTDTEQSTAKQSIGPIPETLYEMGWGGGGPGPNPPAFNNQADFVVNENSAEIFPIKATDPDGDTVTYSIAGADAALFEINRTTGDLRFKAAPDFETPLDAGADNIYNLIITATDTVNSSTQAVSVTVTNVNEAPVITSSANFSLIENGTSVGTIVATDFDAGTALVYSLAGADVALFDINAATGAITFKIAPDHENPGSATNSNIYNLTVTVSDGALNTTQAIVVTVTDANDNSPAITSSASFNSNENTSTVGSVVATDADATSTVTYSITGGADASKFSINATTGNFWFTNALGPDFETPLDTGTNNVYNFTVTASDGTNSTTQAVAVTVVNVNEAPVITSSSTFSLAENGTSVGTIVATDVDAGTTLAYSITGADAALFNINSTTGAITFKSAPDHETPGSAASSNVYNLTVTASDGAINTTQAIVVTVTDANDNAPAITSSNTFSVAENTSAVGTATATDADATSTVTYAISGTDSALFTIDSTTGVLTFQGAPDFESPDDAGTNNVYDFTLTATDGTNNTTQAIAVTVTDANDNTPVVTSSSTFSVAENTTSVGTITATDADAGTTLAYAISGVDAALFTINSSTGALQFKAAPDHETPLSNAGNNSYSLTVTASDGSTVGSQAVTITVTDINDNNPVFTSSAAFSSAENITAIGTVVATDADASSTVEYSIIGGDDQFAASINQSTGALSLNTAHDFEFPADTGNNHTYEITVRATDGTNTTDQNITITVSDTNDNAPVFTSSDTISHAEIGTDVVTATTTDGDAGSTVAYSLSGTDAALFAINSATGQLTFKSPPDYEIPSDNGGDNDYNINILAFDGVNTTTQAVTISVTDVANEGVPIFTSPASFTLAENNTAITTVAATDADPGDTITYSISGGNDSSAFAIDSATGVLTFQSAPDFEFPSDHDTNNAYTLIVEANDGTVGTLQTITVNVTDSNDNAPVFTSNSFSSINENVSTALTVTATDADTVGSVAYSVTGGVDAALFSIHSSTGVLSFIAPPDYENPGDNGTDNTYELNVTASDGTNTTVQNISVTVSNTNDISPVITSSATFTKEEGATDVAWVSATDADFFGTITFSIAGGDAALFTIDSSSGELTFKSAPDFENPGDAGTNNVYNFTLTASDGTNSSTQAVAVTITDTNDTAPTFTSANTFNVAENTTLVGTMAASDPDTVGTLSYNISSGDDAGAFWIDSSSGVLSFNSAPDFETPGSFSGNNDYTLIISVDDGISTTTQSITVTVTNVVNENAPVFTTSADFWINEFTTAVATINATDADVGDTVTYSISGADAALFSINTSTGVLAFLSAPTFGADNVYDLTVSATDTVNTTTQAIQVNVQNVNDAPVFTSSATLSIAENSTTVGTITTTDADGDTVTYSITGGDDSSWFSINASTGVLSFVTAPDVERPSDLNLDNTYNLTVEASDGFSATTQNIAVTVTDIDDAVVGSPDTFVLPPGYVFGSGTGRTIDEIMFGRTWSNQIGKSIDLSYSFNNSDSAYLSGNSYYTNPSEPGPLFKATVKTALDLVSSYTLLNFHEVTDTATTNGTLRFSLDETPGAGGYGQWPGSTPLGGDIILNNTYNWELSANVGSYEYSTISHEIGHTLGLAHPHNGSTTLGIADSAVGSGAEDSSSYTVMSYTQVQGQNVNQGFEPSFMLKDIDALQFLYGANNTTNTGDTTYDAAFLTPNSVFKKSIWDAGGTDTLDWSTGTTAANIDLDGGALSFFGGITGVDDWDILFMTAGEGILGLASDVVIENAIGGSGHDSLRGNTANNTLTGGSGNDLFIFDTLTGVDNITDFTSADDTLQFTLTDFTAFGLSGINPGSTISASDLLIGTSITDASSAGQNFLYDSDSSILYYDDDGVAGWAIQVADLGTSVSLDHTDIVLIA